MLIFATVAGFCLASPASSHYQPSIPAFQPIFGQSQSRYSPVNNLGSRTRYTALFIGSRRGKFEDRLNAGCNDKRVGSAMYSSSEGLDSSTTIPVVARVATKSFDPKSSKPSSREYTTRKGELSEVHVSVNGCEGDYNHYRTLALKNTKDRAVSLLTDDVLIALRSQYTKYDIQDGDLGENIYIAGTTFEYFKIGERYEFISAESDDDTTRTSSPNNVILEITEHMTPCANLCKLPYINQDSLEPKDRIARCKEFLDFLDRYDGYRGWYAKVVQQGIIRTGSTVRRISS